MEIISANKNKLQHAIDYLVKSNAPQIPFDATVIEQVGAVSEAAGFQKAANFAENAKNSPISTLLAFIKFIGT